MGAIDVRKGGARGALAPPNFGKEEELNYENDVYDEKLNARWLMIHTLFLRKDKKSKIEELKKIGTNRGVKRN